MQVSSSLSVSQLKTVSTPSAPPIDRSPVSASLNSSSTSVSISQDVVTFSTPIPASESSDLIQPVPSSGTANDLSPDGTQITSEGSEPEASDGADVRLVPQTRQEDSNQSGDDESGTSVSNASTDASDQVGLSPQQEQVVAELSTRDAEVKAHERAHQAVGGQYAGSMSFAYQTGPDGKRYAIGGEVPIDVSPIAGDPQATIDKMRQIKAAALAPAEPSAQDRSVASTAGRLLIEAQIELAEHNRKEAAQSREQASSSAARTNRAVELYEGFIGLGVKEADPKDLIDELV